MAAGASKGWARLKAVDRMMLAFLALLALTAAARHPRPAPFLGAFAVLAGGLLLASALRDRFAAARAIHDFYPLPAVIAIFNLAGPLVAVANPARWDQYFAAMDRRLFGPLVPAWHSALGRPAWLTDVASLVYLSYYLIPVVMAVALYVRGRCTEFECAAFGFISTLFVSYVGYFLFPTTGPRLPVGAEAEALGGGAVSAGVLSFMHFVELNKLDAFPSGHTALSLVFLAYGWRLFPRWRALLVALVAGIIFSTVYLYWHYVVDLVAGALQALAMTALVPALRRAFGGRPAASAAAPDPAVP